jgi:aspartyl-tRNA(Asn)/glutamyl-tRNA(Gln) amidotransferase subunit C
VSTISRVEVARLAKLARLALTDDELDSFAGQIDAILGYVGAIQAVDVTGVSATENPVKGEGHANVTRPDVVAPSLTQGDALAAAPSVVEERFAVPQILGEEA